MTGWGVFHWYMAACVTILWLSLEIYWRRNGAGVLKNIPLYAAYLSFFVTALFLPVLLLAWLVRRD